MKYIIENSVYGGTPNKKNITYCNVKIFNSNKGKCRPFNYMKFGLDDKLLCTALLCNCCLINTQYIVEPVTV